MLHQVYFWLERPGHVEDRTKLIEGLRSLAAIEEVQSLEIGVPAPTEARDVVDASFDVSETMRFANLADHKAYQDHALHTAFVKQCGHLWRKVAVFDSQLL